MKFQGSLIREQGVTFAVIAVKKRVIDNSTVASKLIGDLTPAFGGIPGKI